MHHMTLEPYPAGLKRGLELPSFSLIEICWYDNKIKSIKLLMKAQFGLPKLHLFDTYSLEMLSWLGDLEALLRDDTLEKALSSIYKQLCIDTARLLLPCHNAWLTNFPCMGGVDVHERSPFAIQILA